VGFRPPLPCDLGIPFLVSQTFCKGPQSSVFQLLINSCSSYSANSGSFEEDLDLKREINILLDPLNDQTIFP
jgi:hypothetical protein